MEEIDWEKHELVQYASDGERALKRLTSTSVSKTFVERTYDLLGTYLSIPSSISTDLHADEIMVKLSEKLYSHLSNLGQRSQICARWPQVINLAERVPDPVLKVQLITQLAVERNEQGAAKEAQYLIEQIVGSADFVGLPEYLKASILFQAGVFYLRQGYYVSATKALNECLVIADSHDYLDLSAYAINQHGNIAMFKGDLKTASKHYKASLKTFEKAGESENLACVAYQSLGRLLVLQGAFEEAIPILEKGLLIRRRRQEPVGISNNMIHLAMAYLGSDQLDAAEGMLNEALQISKQVSDQRAMALCYLAFGTLEMKRKRRNEAITQWQQALKVLEVTPLPPIELQILSELIPQLIIARRFKELFLAIIRVFVCLRSQANLVSILHLLLLKIRMLFPCRSR